MKKRKHLAKGITPLPLRVNLPDNVAVVVLSSKRV